MLEFLNKYNFNFFSLKKFNNLKKLIYNNNK